MRDLTKEERLETLRRWHNVSVANGLILAARHLARQIDTLEADDA